MTDAFLTGHRVRAGVMAFLSDRGAADFTELAGVLAVANNILSGHLQTLEAGGLVRLERGFLERKPRARVVVTALGRRAWAEHLDRLQHASVNQS